MLSSLAQGASSMKHRWLSVANNVQQLVANLPQQGSAKVNERGRLR